MSTFLHRIWIERALLLLVAGILAGTAGCATTRAAKPPATDESPERISALLSQGDKELRKGNYNLAMTQFLKVATKDPKNTHALYGIAVIHTINHDLPRAETIFRAILTIDERHESALEGLGLNVMKQGRLDEAEEHLSRVTAMNRSRWLAQNGLGIIRDLQNHYTQAQARYRKALEVHPNAAHVLNNMGYSKYLAGDLKSAERYFKQVLGLDPTNRNARSNLALVYVRKRDYTSAVRSLEKIMEHHEALNNVGYLSLLAGERDTAETLVREAIRVSPAYYEAAYSNLAQIRTDTVR
jgi:Flp pilus assembly protein TadD